jgi:outer membrane protein OmpA-like peptidoglycan-associated protein
MNDQNDDAQNYALMVLAGLLALVIGGVLALAIYTSHSKGSVKGAMAASATSTPAAMSEPEGRIYFELGSAALPADASAILAKVADTARAQSGKQVVISGYHDASGDAAQNAELAKSRAQAVRHALEADGVSPDLLILEKPILATGDGDAREARRVEMRLR